MRKRDVFHQRGLFLPGILVPFQPIVAMHKQVGKNLSSPICLRYSITWSHVNAQAGREKVCLVLLEARRGKRRGWKWAEDAGCPPLGSCCALLIHEGKQEAEATASPCNRLAGLSAQPAPQRTGWAILLEQSGRRACQPEKGKRGTRAMASFHLTHDKEAVSLHDRELAGWGMHLACPVHKWYIYM